jgi:hypothetical protein
MATDAVLFDRRVVGIGGAVRPESWDNVDGEEDVLDSRNNPGDACHPGLERERAGLVTAQSIPNVLERELPHVA